MEFMPFTLKHKSNYGNQDKTASKIYGSKYQEMLSEFCKIAKFEKVGKQVSSYFYNYYKEFVQNFVI